MAGLLFLFIIVGVNGVDFMKFMTSFLVHVNEAYRQACLETESFIMREFFDEHQRPLNISVNGVNISRLSLMPNPFLAISNTSVAVRGFIRYNDDMELDFSMSRRKEDDMSEPYNLELFLDLGPVAVTSAA